MTTPEQATLEPDDELAIYCNVSKKLCQFMLAHPERLLEFSQWVAVDDMIGTKEVVEATEHFCSFMIIMLAIVTGKFLKDAGPLIGLVTFPHTKKEEND